MRKFILYSVLAVVLLGSCIRRPDGVLSDKEMAPVIADLELAEAYAKTSHSGLDNSKNRALVDYVLAKHGITREQFDSTMSWYGRNADAYYELCDVVDKELSKRKRQVSGSRSIEVETSDLWPYSRQSMISRKSGSDAFEFSLPTSDVSAGQRVNLKLRINDAVTGTALLGVEYDNGQKEYMFRRMNMARRLNLTLQTDTGHTVSRIFGNFMVSDRKHLPVWLDSIYLTTLPYDTLEYYSISGQRRFSDPKARRKPVLMEEESDSVSHSQPEMNRR